MAIWHVFFIEYTSYYWVKPNRPKRRWRSSLKYTLLNVSPEMISPATFQKEPEVLHSTLCGILEATIALGHVPWESADWCLFQNTVEHTLKHEGLQAHKSLFICIEDIGGACGSSHKKGGRPQRVSSVSKSTWKQNVSGKSV